jgi:hypothetical protein
MTDTILIPKDTPDWQSILKDIQGARDTAKDAKSSAISARDKAEKARDDAENAVNNIGELGGIDGTVQNNGDLPNSTTSTTEWWYVVDESTYYKTTDSGSTWNQSGPNLAGLDTAQKWTKDQDFFSAKFKQGPIYDVTHPDFGAVGNGNNNDAPAIQAAFDALPPSGGIIYLPPGEYKLESTITVTKKSFELRGVGGDDSWLRMSEDSSEVLIVESCQGVRIKGIKFSGSSGSLNDFPLVRVTSLDEDDDTIPSKNVRVTECSFYDANSGLRFGYTAVDTNQDGDNEEFRGTKYCWAVDNYFENCKQISVEVFNCEEAHIKNNVIFGGSGDRMIRTVGSINVEVVNNFLDGGSSTGGSFIGWGIDCSNANAGGISRMPKNQRISGNIILGVSGIGVRSKGCRGFLDISDNVIVDTEDESIFAVRFPSDGYLKDGTKKVVENAQIHDNRSINCGSFFRVSGKYLSLSIQSNFHWGNSEAQTGNFVFDNRKANNNSDEEINFASIKDNTIIINENEGNNTFRILNTVSDEYYLIQRNDFIPVSGNGNISGIGGNATLDKGLEDGSGNTFNTNNVIPGSAWDDPKTIMKDL